MTKTLNTYPNLQYDSISIQDFCIVEIYKETIAKDNGLGYCILPIEGLDNSTIEENIKERVAATMPEDATNLAILSEGYSHKIVYAVWYSSDKPEYPHNEPEEAIEAGVGAVEIWDSHEVSYKGATADLELEFTVTNPSFVDFYINNDYFKIYVEKPLGSTHSIVVNKAGVSYNKEKISTFDFPTMPKLKNGLNCLKFNKNTTTHVEIRYVERY
jgi:hypothetical protein